MFSYILHHILLDTLYFPLWWYTRGFMKIMEWAQESLKDAERMAALKIWLKSMFKPMFQDYTKEGRIISFFMRLILLIFKLGIVIGWALFVLIIIVLWLALPIVTAGLLLVSFGYDLISLWKNLRS